MSARSWVAEEGPCLVLDNGLAIGGNDLWIAATAVAYGIPVVTRNTKHYKRVRGLEVEAYASNERS